MENFSYGSYPDSGDSSPRSREIEFDHPPPWEDQTQHHLSQNYKAKFMCSYGGKILPRPHDNHLCYVGGETKIFAVDRSIKLPAMLAKLSALYGVDDVSFKYQLPEEDLDSLISVTNDDDLDHMMHEYDRLYRTTARPARMRLFLFQVSGNSRGSFGSDGSRPDSDQFVEALNAAPIIGPDHVIKPPVVESKAEFMFALEKVVAPPPPPPRPLPPPPFPVTTIVSSAVNPIDTVVGGYAGDYYSPKVAAERIPASLATVPPTVAATAGYWPERHVSSGGFSTPVTSLPTVPEQQVYVIPATGGGALFHQQIVRPNSPAYGPMPPRVATTDVYREPPVYNVIPPPPQFPISATPLSSAAAPITTMQLPNVPPFSAAPSNINIPPLSAALPSTIPPQMAKITAAAATYPEGVGIVRHSGGGVGPGAASETAPYAQVAYDGTMGRQVYYTAPGGVVVAPTVPPPAPMLPQTFPPLTAAVAIGADRRTSGGLGVEGKEVFGKISRGSV